MDFLLLCATLTCALDATRIGIPASVEYSAAYVEEKDFLPRLDIDYEWKTRHTVQEAIYASLTIYDGIQTSRFVARGHIERDVSGLLGKHPDNRTVATVIGASLVLHGAVAYFLPAPFRDVWQYVWIGIEYSAIRTNRSKQ